MTAAADIDASFTASDPIGRWSPVLLFVVAAHLLLGTLLLPTRPPAESAPELAAAVLIDLTPSSPSQAAPSELPPAPTQVAAPDSAARAMDEDPAERPTKDDLEPMARAVAEAVTEPVQERATKDDLEPMAARVAAAPAPEPHARADVVPAARPAATRPPPRATLPERRRETRREAARPPSPATTAPSAATRPAPSAAPQAGARAAAPSISPERWQSAVYRHLERHKRYPRAAQSRGVSGTVQVRFTIDRNGNILSHRITRSSGHPELDEAVSAMIRRASPVPAPPPELFRPGMRVEVPIRFSRH